MLKSKKVWTSRCPNMNVRNAKKYRRKKGLGLRRNSRCRDGALKRGLEGVSCTCECVIRLEYSAAESPTSGTLRTRTKRGVAFRPMVLAGGPVRVSMFEEGILLSCAGSQGRYPSDSMQGCCFVACSRAGQYFKATMSYAQNDGQSEALRQRTPRESSHDGQLIK